jgi:hypothetical protein
MNERDGAAIVAPAAAQEELAQPEAERLPMGKPPVDRFALGVDAITPTKFDQLRLPNCTLLWNEVLYAIKRI